MKTKLNNMEDLLNSHLKGNCNAQDTLNVLLNEELITLGQLNELNIREAKDGLELIKSFDLEATYKTFVFLDKFLQTASYGDFSRVETLELYANELLIDFDKPFNGDIKDSNIKLKDKTLDILSGIIVDSGLDDKDIKFNGIYILH